MEPNAEQQIKEFLARLTQAESKIQELATKLDTARREDTRRTSYSLSSEDQARVQQSLARNAELSQNTGPRPIGGFKGFSESLAKADFDMKSGEKRDTVSDKQISGTVVCNGDGTMTLTITTQD